MKLSGFCTSERKKDKDRDFEWHQMICGSRRERVSEWAKWKNNANKRRNQSTAGERIINMFKFERHAKIWYALGAYNGKINLNISVSECDKISTQTPFHRQNLRDNTSAKISLAHLNMFFQLTTKNNNNNNLNFAMPLYPISLPRHCCVWMKKDQAFNVVCVKN